MGRRLALVIATYDYQDPGLRRLTAPAHDAEALAAVLRDPTIAGFEITTLINEPLHRVGEAIGDLYRDRRRDDLTLLYFTGHGLKDDDGRLYLAMTNTVRDNLLFTGLPAEQVDQAMERCASRQKVLVLDCCYSGAFPAGRLAKADSAVHTLERFQGRGRTVLTASDTTQYSFEGEQTHGEAVQSVFTRHLVAGLRDGSADLDGDGDITIDELYSYVHDRVVAEMPQQRPKKQDNVEGRIVIARNINWTLPTYLRNAIGSPIAADRLAALDGLAHLHRIGNDMVRNSVELEIRSLSDDDSKAVSDKAMTLRRAIHPEPEQPEQAPETTEERPPPAPLPVVEEQQPPVPLPVVEDTSETPPAAASRLHLRPTTRRAKVLTSAAAVVILAVAVTLVVLLTDHNAQPGWTPRLVTTLNDPASGSIQSVAFSPSGRTLATGGMEGARLWDSATSKVISTLSVPTTGGFPDEVYGVAFSPDGGTLATCASGSPTRLWNTATGTLTTALTDPSASRAFTMAFTPDGKMLAAGGDGAQLWDVATAKITTNFAAAGVGVLAFSPDVTTLVTGGNGANGQRLWNTAKHQVTAILTGSGPFTSAAFSRDGKTLATGDGDTARLWDVTTGKIVKTLSGHTGTVKTVAFSPDGKTLATGSLDTTVRLWNVATGQTIATLTDPNGDVSDVEFSPDGRTLAVVRAQTVKLWDVVH